jgi:quinol monooxygenase YgiN
MRGKFWILGVAAAADILFASNSRANAVQSFSVTFVDAQSSSPVARALKSDMRTCLASSVCDEAAALKEIGRDRFVLYESYDAFPRPQQPALSAEVLLAPPDTRQLLEIWTSAAMRMPLDALWVVTHVDGMPDYAAKVASMLRQLGEANVREAGHLRTIAGAQLDHHHFTLIEVWVSRSTFEMHERRRRRATSAPSSRPCSARFMIHDFTRRSNKVA